MYTLYAHLAAMASTDFGLVGSGRTAALVGSSGVGKSTLINAMIGEDVQDTGGIRVNDDRGKHTTTTRTLLPLAMGGCLVDTPGMRELGLWEGQDALAGVYADIHALAEGCRYRDCEHQAEPGCEVLKAIEQGDLEAGRLKGLKKLERELAREERRKQPRWKTHAANRRRSRMIRNSSRDKRRLMGMD
jgi:ribosome biogenesis GTPase